MLSKKIQVEYIRKNKLHPCGEYLINPYNLTTLDWAAGVNLDFRVPRIAILSTPNGIIHKRYYCFMT